MNQINFGGYRSYDDLYLLLSKKEIGSPKVKEYTIKVEGGDGVLDYTDYFGGAKYDNLTHKFTFTTTIQPALTYFSRLKNLLHGKKMHITLDEDSDYYYVGRLSVSSLTNEKNIYALEIECDCEPYKYKNDVTVVTQTVSGSATITLSNMRKKVVPKIITTAEMTFTFAETSVTHTAGTFYIPEFELSEGDNVVTVTGTGNVTFEYQEGGM